MYKKYVKRCMDILLSFIGIIIVGWIILIIMVLIKCTSKGPAFFRQKRIGNKKREFYILKFRTMRIDAPKDTPTHLLENANSYITPIGRFLRKTSLDELPQIFNILSGEMSIIGPRPALWNQYDLIAERDKYGANDIRPGLTGWAQINGRDELPIHVKACLDGEYIKRLSFVFDVKIFLLTFASVWKKEGVKEGKNFEESLDYRRE